MSGDWVRERGCGAVFVISAASGSGKSTLIRLLRQSVGGLRFSVSHTTRSRRPDEEDGRDYHFVDVGRFAALRERGEFLEWAEVHGELYGTSTKEIEAAETAGEDVLLDLDIQGAEAVRRARPDAILVFILPPDRAELRRRLESRGTPATEIERRLTNAANELAGAEQFDYLVLNQRLDQSASLLEGIVLAERSRFARRRDLWERVAATFPGRGREDGRRGGNA